MTIGTVRGNAVALLLGVALAWGVVLSTRDIAQTTSGTWDETVYLDLGRHASLTGDLEKFATHGVAPLPVLLAWNRAALAPLDPPFRDPGPYRARVANARRNAVWWFGVPLVLGVYAWLSSRHGWAVGFVAAALLAMSPNIIAHAALATTDVCFTAAFVLTLAALTGYLEVQSWQRAGSVALALGVALASKYSAIGLFVCAGILLWWHRRGRRRDLDLCVLPAALIVAWGAHGWAVAPIFSEGDLAAGWVERLSAWTGGGQRVSAWLTGIRLPSYVRGIAAQIQLDRAGQDAFLLGETRPFGWWYYLPVALAMKSTLVEICAFAVFAVMAIADRGRNVERQVLVTAAVVFGGLALTGQRNLGVRYALPLIVLAVMGSVVWLSGMLRNRTLATVAAAAALTAQAVSFLSVAPQQLAYFNVFAGGPSRGYLRLVDSNLDWGQDLPRLATWLGEHATDRVSLAYFGLAPPQAYGIQAVRLRDLDPQASSPPTWFALSATYLQGIFVCGDPFAPLRGIEPSARIGFSMFVYATDRPDVRQALDRVRHDPCTP